MTEEEFANLRPGDCVQAAGGSGSWIIVGFKHGGGFVAIQQTEVTNHLEWRQIPQPPAKKARNFAS